MRALYIPWCDGALQSSRETHAKFEHIGSESIFKSPSIITWLYCEFAMTYSELNTVGDIDSWQV